MAGATDSVVPGSASQGSVASGTAGGGSQPSGITGTASSLPSQLPLSLWVPAGFTLTSETPDGPPAPGESRLLIYMGPGTPQGVVAAQQPMLSAAGWTLNRRQSHAGFGGFIVQARGWMATIVASPSGVLDHPVRLSIQVHACSKVCP